MIINLKRLFCLLVLATATSFAHAAFDPVNDDTDIFLANPNFTSTRPNILIFIDNSANWSSTSSGTTKYAAVRAALKSVLTNIVTDAYNIGLGLFVETGTGNNNVDGAYIRFGIRQMTGTDTDLTTNKGKLIDLIDKLGENADKGNGAKYSISFSEIFKYFGGLTSRAGHGKVKSDAGGSVYVNAGRQVLAGSPLPATALPSSSLPSAYISPIVDGCQKNFVIFISNGEANDATADINTAETLFANDTGTTPVQIAISPNGSQGILADEYAKYMATGDCNASLAGTQNVFTYTIDTLPRTIGQGPAHTALLKSMASNGKGKYFAVNSIASTTELETIFTTIFKEVQAVNSVFASTTLPVSVNVRGTNLNQVYIGVFRPDENKNPRWYGNLKLYKLGEDSATNTLFLADAAGNVAENATTGFISSNAQSFWTATESPGFWAFNPTGAGGALDLPDGDLVEKGGAAQRLRVAFASSQATRNIYTCTNGSGGLCSTTSLLSATPFNTTNISAADLGVATNTDRDNLVNWVRGADNVNPDENLNSIYTDIRASIHGDVLHSRPAIINYNRYSDDNDIYAFYGSNDGLLRAVKGGIAAHTTGPDTLLTPGLARWSFVPKEFFTKLDRLRSQSPAISSTTTKDYFFDGPIGVYQKDANNDGILKSSDGDKVYLYAALRRGGDFIYAFDVSDPGAPRLLWRKGFGDSGWSQVGQTWSEPKVARVSADIGNSSNPDNIVLIFGGGYDNAVDDVNPCLLNKSTASDIEIKAIGAGTVTYTDAGSCTISGASGSATTVSRTKGRAIYIVDAFNGNVVWRAGGATVTQTSPKRLNVPNMTCAVSSDVSVLDINRDGIADRLYVGDTCGQMWRVNLFGTDMDEWSVTRIANISSTTSSDIANKRKFLFPPDLVLDSDANGNYTAVLAGSGDREHAFDTTVTNAFYMFKDRNDSTEILRGADNSTTVKISGFSTTPTGNSYTSSSLFNATSSVVDSSDPLSLNGWRITLLAGEKVISSSTTVGGSTFFNTNQPSATAAAGICTSNLGVAREYIVNFSTAGATQDLNALGNLSIANRSSIRAGGGFLPSPVPVVVEINGHKHEAVISGTSVRQPPSTTLDKRVRVYWYKNVD